MREEEDAHNRFLQMSEFDVSPSQISNNLAGIVQRHETYGTYTRRGVAIVRMEEESLYDVSDSMLKLRWFDS